jgi:hypothetical protein
VKRCGEAAGSINERRGRKVSWSSAWASPGANRQTEKDPGHIGWNWERGPGSEIATRRRFSDFGRGVDKFSVEESICSSPVKGFLFIYSGSKIEIT